MQIHQHRICSGDFYRKPTFHFYFTTHLQPTKNVGFMLKIKDWLWLAQSEVEAINWLYGFQELICWSRVWCLWVIQPKTGLNGFLFKYLKAWVEFSGKSGIFCSHLPFGPLWQVMEEVIKYCLEQGRAFFFFFFLKGQKVNILGLVKRTGSVVVTQFCL